jgi:hypothetical protein
MSLEDYDETAFLDAIRGTLPADDRIVMDRISRVKDVYVECGRDIHMRDTFQSFVIDMLSQKGGRRDDGLIFFLTGPSGTGKSRAVERLLASSDQFRAREFEFGSVRPAVSVSLTGPATLKVLGRQILHAAGYPVTQNIEQGILWSSVLPTQLRHRRVLLVHIDETQHLLRQTDKDTERLNLAKSLKGLMNNREWPISFLMSGMPETTELARLDNQIGRRQYAVELPRIELPADRAIVKAVISELAAAGGIDCRDAVAGDLPDRVAHASDYMIGRVSQTTVAAISQALLGSDAVLKRQHFVRAYEERSHAMGREEHNPFLVEAWHQLPPGLFFPKQSRGDA